MNITLKLDVAAILQLISILLTAIGFVVAWITYRARIAQNRSEWTASLINDFLLHPRNISVRRNLELSYKELLNNYIQATLSGDNPLLFCSEKEIESSRELEDFFAQLEFFCYLESTKTILNKDLEASLGFWLNFIKQKQFAAVRVYLQENSFEFLVERLGGPVEINRILVYGTLKSGTPQHKAFGLEECSKSLGVRNIPGQLFAVHSDYPGANLNLDMLFSNYPPKVSSTFQCELLEIDTDKVDWAKLLRKLDQYENEGTNQEYRRFLVPCDDAVAWIYAYVEPTAIHQKIESGIWDQEID